MMETRNAEQQTSSNNPTAVLSLSRARRARSHCFTQKTGPVPLTRGGGCNSSGAVSTHASSLTCTEIQGGEPCTCHRCPGPAWSVLSRGQMFHWRRDPRPDDLPEVTGLHEERPPRLLPRSQSPSTRSNLWLSSRPAKWSGERCARAAPRAPEAPSSSPALHPLRQVVSLLSLYFPVSKVG